MARRRRARIAAKARVLADLDSANWQINADEIEICRAEDGSDWLLGSGSFGQVWIHDTSTSLGCRVLASAKSGIMRVVP